MGLVKNVNIYIEERETVCGKKEKDFSTINGKGQLHFHHSYHQHSRCIKSVKIRKSCKMTLNEINKYVCARVCAHVCARVDTEHKFLYLLLKSSFY